MSTPFRARHLIIGAGFSGLGMARAFAKANIPYDQVDAADHIGGNWYQGVYNHVHLVSSKRTTEYTDFPMPQDYPDFPNAKQMLDYLDCYASFFQLNDQIELKKNVMTAYPRSDHRWHVTFEDGESRIYRGLVICNGHHWSPRHPEYPGKFSGSYLHSKEYKSTDVLRGKRVLVIGAGNSACDIAVDAAREAEEAHISMRSGHWILPKTIFGAPLTDHLRPWMPQFVQRALVRLLVRMFIGKYSAYGLQQPKHGVFDKHPTINSLLPYYVHHGVIKVHPAVKSWNGKEVTFTDGSRREFDVVVAATGFRVTFPFLPDGTIPVKGVIPQIPFGSFHDRYKGLYVIGWMQPRIGVGPLIAAGGPMICEFIRAEERMVGPLGAVLGRLGVGIPKTNVGDGHQLLRRIAVGRRIARFLPAIERLVFKHPVRKAAMETARPSQAARADNPKTASSAARGRTKAGRHAAPVTQAPVSTHGPPISARESS